MARKRGDVSESGIKADIIKFILENKESPIDESKIRGSLKKDQGNVNRDLHQLEELGCIELTQTIKKGHRTYNHWDITKTEHLKNIKDKFHDIQLNKYEKSLMIVLQKNRNSVWRVDGIKFYIKLLISPSFFNACISTNINILCERAWKIYARKNSIEIRRINNLLKMCYTLYITRYSNFKMSYESFESMMTQMSQREDIHPTEMFMKIWEEELLGLPKETLDEMHRETMKEDLKIYRYMSFVTSDIHVRDTSFKSSHFNVLFEHYLDQDSLDDVEEEEEEMEFVIETKANEEEESGWMDATEENIALSEKRYLSDLEQVSKILYKYKHPSIDSIP